MFFFDRLVDGRKYRVAADSVWDPRTKQPVSRQVLLGPADPAPVADLARTRTIGTRRVGDVGGLGWVAEQLNVVRHLNEALAEGAVRSVSFSSRRRHTRCDRDWSSDVCSSDLENRSAGRHDTRGTLSAKNVA